MGLLSRTVDDEGDPHWQACELIVECDVQGCMSRYTSRSNVPTFFSEMSKLGWRARNDDKLGTARICPSCSGNAVQQILL